MRGTLLLVGLAFALSGCLPLLISSAKTLKPGELTLAVAGMGRTSRLPEGIEQAGPAVGVVEIRGGLPGDRLEAGFTLQAPWHMVWDFKFQALHETRIVPAVAAQAYLGLITQPTLGGALLATKTIGPVEVTGMGGMGRSNERLWRAGSGPFSSDESEKFTKDIYAWGGGVECHLSPVHSLFVNVTSWSAVHEDKLSRENLTSSPFQAIVTANEFNVNEGPTFFFSAGIRLRWKLKSVKSTDALTVLRGYVLKSLDQDEFEVGQPGVYRATVLVDAHTRITADGAPAGQEKLAKGRAVLIHGISLPQPSTFLARTIELQN